MRPLARRRSRCITLAVLATALCMAAARMSVTAQSKEVTVSGSYSEVVSGASGGGPITLTIDASRTALRGKVAFKGTRNITGGNQPGVYGFHGWVTIDLHVGANNVVTGSGKWSLFWDKFPTVALQTDAPLVGTINLAGGRASGTSPGNNYAWQISFPPIKGGNPPPPPPPPQPPPPVIAAAPLDFDSDGVLDADDLCAEKKGTPANCGCPADGPQPGELLFRYGVAASVTKYVGAWAFSAPYAEAGGQSMNFGHVAVYAGDFVAPRGFDVRHDSGLLVQRPNEAGRYDKIVLAKGDLVHAGDIVPDAIFEADAGFGGVGISNLANFRSDNQKRSGDPDNMQVGSQIGGMNCQQRRQILARMAGFELATRRGQSPYGFLSNNCASTAAAAYQGAGLDRWNAHLSDVDVLTPNYLASWLDLRPLDKAAVASGDLVPWSRSPLNAYRTAIYMKSPVRVHVYDSRGRHTGPVAGGLEARIPGTEYWELENGHKILNVLAKTPGRMTMKLAAYERGTFDLDLVLANSARAGAIVKAYFTQVSISPTTVAKVELNPDAMTAASGANDRDSLVMLVDDDGNGTNDRKVFPRTETKAIPGTPTVDTPITPVTPDPSFATASSVFSNGPDGWTGGSFPDNGPYDRVSSSAVVKWTSSAGRSGGAISITDVDPGNFFFQAPAPYLGDKRSFYSGELRYDLKTENGELFDEADVILIGEELVLVYRAPGRPSTSWSSMRVPLVESSWHIDRPTGRAPSREEFLRALGNVTALRIRGEYRMGVDTGWISNVSLARR